MPEIADETVEKKSHVAFNKDDEPISNTDVVSHLLLHPDTRGTEHSSALENQVFNENLPSSDKVNEAGDIMKKEPTTENKGVVVNNEPRYTRRERRMRERFIINVLRRVRQKDEPTTRDAFKSLQNADWQKVDNTEIDTLEEMDCRDVIHRPQGKQIPHTTYALKRKRNKKGEVCKNKLQIVIYSSEENYEDVNFSPLADFTNVKLIFVWQFRKHGNKTFLFSKCVSKWDPRLTSVCISPHKRI